MKSYIKALMNGKKEKQQSVVISCKIYKFLKCSLKDRDLFPKVWGLCI